MATPQFIPETDPYSIPQGWTTGQTPQGGTMLLDAQGNGYVRQEGGFKFFQPAVSPTQPTAPTLTDRYFGSSSVESPLDKARRELAEQMKANSTVPDAQSIRDQIYKNSQAYIDAVGKIYDQRVAEERNQGDIRNAQVRAFNISSGNVGGDFASSNAAAQETKNKRAIDVINEERQLKLNEIFDKLDQRAKDEFEAKKQEALGNAQGYIKYLEENQADSLSKIADIAKAGLSLAEFKKQQTATGENVYDFIKRTTGKSDLELDALYLSNLPPQEKPTIHFEKVGNKILQFITDSKGNTEKKEYATDIGEGEDFKEIDGVPYALKTNPDGTLSLRKLEGYTPGEEKALELENKRLQNQKLQQEISSYTEGLNPKQIATFNSIVDKYNKSPLIQAADKMKGYLNTIQSAGTGETNPQKDLNLIYAYIKALDYGESAVREGEINLGMDTGTVRQQLESQYNKLLSGKGLLSASQRENYISAARELINSVNAAAQAKEKAFASQAKVSGVEKAWTDYRSGFDASYDSNGSSSPIAAQINEAQQSGYEPGDIINQLLQPGSPVRDQVLEAQRKQWSPEQILDYLKKANGATAASSSARKIAEAIKQEESGGDYNAKGKSGEIGAYQFTPATWKDSAQKYLGNANAPMTKDNQDKVALAKIQDLLDQGYNDKEIALIWNGGQPKAKKGVNAFGVAYDSGSYAQRILNRLRS